MGKTKETNREFCSRMVKEFTGTFRTDGQILFCNFCESLLAGASKKWVLTEKHKSFLFENLKQHCIALCNREK